MRSFGGWLALFVFVALAASCASTPPAIPVGGNAEGVSKLANTWNDEYSSQATQRYGSIRFTLAVNSDTTFGDVTMQPRKSGDRAPVVTEGTPTQATPPPPLQILRIAFVRATGDTVAGVLDPYTDPDCACTVLTRFAGRLRGDRITGRYSTRNMTTGAETFGEWNVQRGEK
jgi:hypothetical protein